MDVGNSSPYGAEGLWRFFRSELADYPGRMSWALRILVTSLVVVVLSMTFEVPVITISVAVIVYSGLQSNATVTRLICLVFLVGTLLEVGTLLLVLKFTYDYPLARIVVSSLIFLVCMYLARVHKAGIFFFAIGAVLIYGQTTIDTLDFPELALRFMLWMVVVCTYPVAVLWVINLHFFPLEEPLSQLRREVHRQLSEVSACLERFEVHGNANHDPVDARHEGSAPALRKLHTLSCLQDKSYRAAKSYWLACIDAMSYLDAVARNLSSVTREISSEERSLLQKLREQVKTLDVSFSRLEPYRSDWSTSPAEAGIAEQLGLGGFCRSLQALASADPAQVPAADDKKGRMLAADAFTNPAYIRFALKVLLASMICYVFYHAVQWDGIHTSMITCAIVANPNMGATSEKLILRFGGAMLGGLLAFLFTVFLLPHVDGIVGLLLMIAPVYFLGAWIAVGSARTAYIGVQMVATFSLAFLEHFGPSIDLVEVRDRTIGILVGTLVSAVVYTVIWPESEAGSLRVKLADLMRELGRLIAAPVQRSDKAQRDYLQQRMSCCMATSACEEIRRRVSLEGNLRGGDRQMLLERSGLVLQQSVRILKDWDAMRDSLLVAQEHLQPCDELDTWRQTVEARMQRYADAWSASGAAGTWPSLDLTGWDNGSPCVAKAATLAQDIEGLPGWDASGAVPATTPVQQA